MRIRREEAHDAPDVRVLNVTAFGSATEANIVDVLRSQAHDVLSLVAEEDGTIVGHIMFSPITLGSDEELRALGLAPMAVHPGKQRQGIMGVTS